MFVRNAWYVAAWDRSLTDNLLPLTILGEHIVLYRQSNGRPAALEDACVHRKLPLSMGRIRGDEVECGYHGLRFDAQGQCVHIPCSDRIPRNARVRSYPVRERYGLIWIWMGEPALAPAAAIMSIDHWGSAAWAVTDGDTMTIDCNYLFMTDNLLDPSHVAWVHPTSFGDAACEATPVAVAATADGVTASRWMYSTQVAPLYQRFVPFSGRCDRLQHYEVRFPSHALVKAVFVPEGTVVADHDLADNAFRHVFVQSFDTRRRDPHPVLLVSNPQRPGKRSAGFGGVGQGRQGGFRGGPPRSRRRAARLHARARTTHRYPD